MCCTSGQDRALMQSPPGITIFWQCFDDTMAALSGSQNREVPPALAMHFSSIPRSRRPPDVIREPICGANHFPGFSTTSEVVSNDSSPENTRNFVPVDSFGLSSTKRPYDPLLARIFSQ